MKKVLVAALLCAVSSFASWSIMAPKGAGQGEAKLGFQYDMNTQGDKFSQMGLNLGARYGIIEGLEAAVMLWGSGYALTCDYDGTSCEDLGMSKGTGLNRPVIGLRYFLPMGVGAFADFILPVGSEDRVSDDPDFGLKLGAQYVTKFTEELEFGSEVAFYNMIEDDVDFDMSIAAEVDYNLGVAIPLLNLSLANLLGDKTLKFNVKPGVKVPFAGMFIADVAAGFCVAGDGCGDGDMPIVIGANLGVHF